MAVPQPEYDPVKKNRTRLAGIGLLILAAGACYFSIVMPLQEASAHADKITWGAEWSFLAPPLVMIGILAVVFPNLHSDENFLMKGKDRLSVAGWILLALLVGFGGSCYYLVNQQLDAMGYTDSEQSPGSK